MYLPNCALESGWFESKRRKGEIGENVILVLLEFDLLYWSLDAN